MTQRYRRWAVIASLALLVLVLPIAASAQQMNFSFYTDAYVDSGTLYTIVSGYDNSSGCTHYGYQTVGHVSGPTGYYEQTFPGLQSFIGVPTAEGNYSIWSNAFVDCSCFGTGLDAGGGSGTIFGEAFMHRYVRSAIGNPSTYKLEAESSGRACSHSTLTWSPPAPEPTWMNDEGLYYRLFGEPIACMSECKAGHLPASGPSGQTLGPAACG